MQRVYERFFNLSFELLATAAPDGHFRELNPVWEATLGYTLDELRARPFVELVHPDDREQTAREAAKLFAGEPTIRFENRYMCRDGSYKWLSWMAVVAAEDGLIYASARDITAYKQALHDKDTALAEAASLRALAEGTTDLVALTDLNGVTTYINAAGKKLLLGGGERSMGAPLAEHFTPDHARKLTTEIIPMTISRGHWYGEGTLLRADGDPLPITQVTVLIRNQSGEPLSIGTIIRDVSEFKNLQEDLVQRHEQIRAAMQAMSTPLIPITDHILIMPLIGTIDSERAEQVLSAALEGVQSSRGQVVIIDVTGMKHVDTSVAGTLINTAKALRLLGAETVLTGIRAEMAQTLVRLGIDLATIVTRSNLQSGIAYALSAAGQGLPTGPRPIENPVLKSRKAPAPKPE